MPLGSRPPLISTERCSRAPTITRRSGRRSMRPRRWRSTPSPAEAPRNLSLQGFWMRLECTRTCCKRSRKEAGVALPAYATVLSGLGHFPLFTCTVELAGISFTGEPAKNKKQAEKNAAMAAWSSLKQLSKQAAASSSETRNNDEQEQITIARALVNYRLKELSLPNHSIPTTITRRPTTPEQKFPAALKESKILPLIRSKPCPRNRAPNATDNSQLPQPKASAAFLAPPASHGKRQVRHPTPHLPYMPVPQFRGPYRGSPSMAPAVTIRTAVPDFSAMPLPPPPPMCRPPQVVAPPVQMRSVVPVFATPPPPPPTPPPVKATAVQPDHGKEVCMIDEQSEVAAVESLKQLQL